MLRAIGGRRSQVLRSVLLEAVVVGVLAAAVGIGAGIGLCSGCVPCWPRPGSTSPGATWSWTPAS